MRKREPDVRRGATGGDLFTATAKHLFRHLHDARSLRKNLLVRRFFFRGKAGVSSEITDNVALARIHQLVRQAAERCREADLRDGRESRAFHQHAIVVQQCLGGRPIAAVADELGISYKHCYRQRAEICRRIARYISQCDDGDLLQRTPDVDTFRIALDRARHRCTLVDARSSLRECEELARSAPSASQSIEALRIGATNAMYFGDIESAKEFCVAAKRIYTANQSDSSFGRVVAQACIDLMENKVAYYGANMVEALRLAEHAVHELGSVWRGAPERIRELYVESLYDMASALSITGNLDRTHQVILEAQACSNRITVSSARLRARLALASWKLRTCFLLSSATFCRASERCQGLLLTFDLAYGSGALPEATSAIVALAENHALGANDDEALRAARLGLALAGALSERVQTQTSISVALTLSMTRYWAFGLTLLPDAVILGRCDPLHREMAAHAIAKRALRTRHFEDAWTLATNTDGPDDFTALAVGQRIVAAQAAHRLGHRRDAQALIEAILPAAERLSDAAVLRDAYDVAAGVTGEMRFKHRARELAKLLAE